MKVAVRRRPAPAENLLPELPAEVSTREGARFDPRPDIWTMDGIQSALRIDFSRAPSLSPSLKLRLKFTLVSMFQNRSTSHARNSFESYAAFCRKILGNHETDEIRLEHLLKWRQSLTPTTVWKLAVVRGLLERAEGLGFGMCSQEAHAYLRDAVIPGNRKGVDVRTRDPDRGPFTTLELETLNAAINRGYASGRVSLSDYGLCLMLMAYGIRPMQIASMKVSDLIPATGAGGETVFTLRIPRAKQRGHVARDSFRFRACDARIGEVLTLLSAQVTGRFAGIDSGQAPLFIGAGRGGIPGFDFHMSAKEVGVRVTAVLGTLAPFPANARRFRYTLATRARDDGANIFVLADLLDHSDTQNVKVYTEGGPDVVETLNRTMALELAPVAQAFAGLLVSRHDPLAAEGGTGKRIHERALSDGDDPLGNCGRHGFCGLTRPLACYTCMNFRPWEDGPHSQMLDRLLAERELQRLKGRSPRIYGLLDRTVAAIAMVVRLCENPRGEVG